MISIQHRCQGLTKTGSRCCNKPSYFYYYRHENMCLSYCHVHKWTHIDDSIDECRRPQELTEEEIMILQIMIS
jgi:hypothetical protein